MSVIEPVPELVTDPGVIGPVILLVHEKVVPAIVAVGTKVNATPLQICCDKLDDVFVTTGTGLTVATTSNVGPGQLLLDGVILYVTVPFVRPFVEVSTCDIKLPVPFNAPVTLELVNTVHENVVPATALGLVISILVDCPEQIV